ncbi:GNAT family N-acetyltransferase [Streptomyces benahoarensis]|uniref:GNAT family N-acetyltransferase n=1 Tax=Streptomyces benahoarensis TaxID=2595054 RepID=A0A553ZH47_9ACTN|nr:GNAT family N-acetyltransferase [Streptomyces benahoarensis]TSB13854.1 GNAT family N-acetyltransferase [Streptomyces benahoarensis]TSB40762.1 GNAT family N-acetyltransferase [Streptomyces benahoarensis]
MTTTLRPAGPEDRDGEGHRARRYDICVNSRRVGGVRLITDPLTGPATGRIEELAVDAADRRRGRATVAALAAEEILRGWGCRRIALTVLVGGEAALRLAAALGYTERARGLAKVIVGAPPLPPGAEDRPLTDAGYPAWRATALADRARLLAAPGLTSQEAARAAEAEHRALLPGGAGTPHHAVRLLAVRGTGVGHVWVDRRPPDLPGGRVLDVLVAPEHRGHGHGRALLGIAERECLAAGAPLLGLTVRTDDAAARGLCAALGYRPTTLLLAKPIL